jgi:hypothetical protein
MSPSQYFQQKVWDRFSLAWIAFCHLWVIDFGHGQVGGICQSGDKSPQPYLLVWGQGGAVPQRRIRVLLPGWGLILGRPQTIPFHVNL